MPAHPRRFDLNALVPGAARPLVAFEAQVERLGLDPLLLELLRVRVSQLNGCAYCLDMHTKDARARGEAEARLHAVAAWREASCFTDRERAALAWAEAVTLVSAGQVPDGAYEAVRAHFTELEIAGLLLATVSINAWNRLAVAQRLPAGGYVSPHGARAAAPPASLAPASPVAPVAPVVPAGVA